MGGEGDQWERTEGGPGPKSFPNVLGELGGRPVKVSLCSEWRPGAPGLWGGGDKQGIGGFQYRTQGSPSCNSKR